MSEELFQPADQILSGETSDVYFLRTREIMEREGLNPRATMEFFSSRAGLLCGMREVEALLRAVLADDAEVWALTEGATMAAREVVLRLTAPYLCYGIYETAILGILASETAWATAAAECVEAAGGIPVASFGARHVHPLAAPYMDYAAIVGGCQSGSTSMGSLMAGKEPSGTMPHAMVLCFGDTVRAAAAFDRHMPPEVARVVLVDTFGDEAQESLRVAAELGERLNAVRLDTPSERGGVTPELVRETRARLDQAGFAWVGIFVSGGVTPERIRRFIESGAPVAGFGVGSYISSAAPNDFTADIKEIEGRPVAKRGRIPGITANDRLQRLI
ncbi:MAG: nicotinate phosphoribosyltransferase [Chloroflexi bacterium]|nr:MAG: nicotinate phosphoribosyltransferase [Chloroflexota bacterium]